MLFQNAAVPIALLIGAILVTIGFKTRFTAITLIVVLVGRRRTRLVSIDSLAGALDWMPRLTVIFGLVIPSMTGAGRLSIDGLRELHGLRPRRALKSRR